MKYKTLKHLQLSVSRYLWGITMITIIKKSIRTSALLLIVAGTMQNQVVAMHGAAAHAVPAHDPLKVNYFGEKLVVPFEVADRIITLDCGQGGSGNILTPLESVHFSIRTREQRTLRVNRRPEAPIGLLDVIQVFSEDDASMAPVLEAIQLYVNGAQGETLPPIVNLLVRSCMLMRSNLNSELVFEQIIILCARYKLSLLVEQPVNEGRLAGLFNSVKGLFITETPVAPAPIVPVDARPGRTASRVVPVEPVLDPELARTLSTTERAQLLASMRQTQRPGTAAAATGPTTQNPLAGTPFQELYALITTRDIRLELTPEEQRLIAARDAAGKSTMPMAQRLTILAKLVLKALHNMHNELAAQHQILIRDANYQAAQTRASNQEREALAFLATDFGNREIAHINAAVQRITAANRIAEGANDTQIIATTIRQQDTLLAVYNAKIQELEQLIAQPVAPKPAANARVNRFAAAANASAQDEQEEGQRVASRYYLKLLTRTTEQLQENRAILNDFLGFLNQDIPVGHADHYAALEATQQGRANLAQAEAILASPLLLPTAHQNLFDRVNGLLAQGQFQAISARFTAAINASFTLVGIEGAKRNIALRALAHYAPGLFPARQ